MRNYTFFVFLVGLMMLSSVNVSACGGFFCQNTPIDQSAERIIFTVNGNDTITAVIGITYEGAAEDFSWLLPVPSVPEVDVAEQASLDTIQLATDRRFTNPTNYCPNILSCECGGGGGDDFGIVEGSVGPYDYVVLSESDPQVVVQWLRDFGYRITDEMIPLIEYYVVVEQMHMLAMRLSQGYEAGDIKPVKLTYQGHHPMIPIILTSVAATSDMPILTWIFGETQYVPDNWAHVEADFSRFRAASMILNPFPFWNAQGNYSREQSRIQAEYEGLAFITEYAQPTSQFRELAGIVDDPLLDELSTRFAYVTRLRAQLSPEQMTVDPTFVPATSPMPDVDNNVDMNDYVDPLQFWGCSSRSIRSLSAEEQLSTYIRIGTTHFAYPEGWIRTELVSNGVVFHAFAAQTVTTEDIIANINGESDLPIVVYVDMNQTDGNGDSGIRALTSLLSMPNDSPTQSENQRWLFGRRENLYDFPWPYEHLFILTTVADYEANMALYDAMMRYFNTHQFYASLRLRHTLFLGAAGLGVSEYGNVYFGYPDGWIEYMTDDGVITIVPEGFDPDDVNAPAIRLYSLSQLGIEGISTATFPAIVERYNLSDEAQTTLSNRFFPNNNTFFCSYQAVDGVMYEKDGRQGFISSASNYVIEASAPVADFATYADVLRIVPTTLTDPWGSCG